MIRAALYTAKAFGYFVLFSIIGILFRIAADFLYIRMTFSHLKFTNNNVGPITKDSDLLNVSVSFENLLFGLSFNQMRLGTIVILIPAALALAYSVNRLFKPRSLFFVPIAILSFFLCFFSTKAGVADPSTLNTFIFVIVFSILFVLLFRKQTGC